MKNKLIYASAAIAVIVIAAYFILSKPNYTPGSYSEHVTGNLNANITIVEFSDFQCPFCGAAEPTVKQVIEKYGKNVKFVYKHFPLPIHAFAQKSAEASECAADQNKFWEYHDKIFANQNTLSLPNMKLYAQQLGLDTKKFNDCLDSGVMASRVSADREEGISRGVTGTPTFFINSDKLAGNRPFSDFERAITQKLG